MTRMVRSKKEFVCSKCGKSQIKWSGFCGGCKEVGTLEEKRLLPEKPKPTKSQRSIGERAKRSERSVAKSMLAADGPAPEFRGIATSTGRVGHITNLQFDAVSRSHVTENKNRMMPSWLIKAWIQINQRALDFRKEALLHIDPPNMPKTFILNGKREPLSTMAIITEKHMEHLVSRDRMLSQIEEAGLESMDAITFANKVMGILRGS